MVSRGRYTTVIAASLAVVVSVSLILSGYFVREQAEITAKNNIEHYRNINCTVIGIRGEVIPASGHVIVEYAYSDRTVNNNSSLDKTYCNSATLNFDRHFTVMQLNTFVEHCCTPNSIHNCLDGREFDDGVYFEKKPPYKSTTAYRSKEVLVLAMFVCGSVLLGITVVAIGVVYTFMLVVNTH